MGPTRLHRFRYCSLTLVIAAALILAATAAHPQSASGQRQGAQDFAATCSLCHGGDARGTDRAPSLVNNNELRGMTEADIAGIIRKGRGRMPAFSLPPEEVYALAHFVQSLNPTASALSSSGDANRGEIIFFGEGQCSSCHMVRGRGSANGPDLSSIGKTLSAAEPNPGLNRSCGACGR